MSIDTSSGRSVRSSSVRSSDSSVRSHVDPRPIRFPTVDRPTTAGTLRSIVLPTIDQRDVDSASRWPWSAAATTIPTDMAASPDAAMVRAITHYVAGFRLIAWACKRGPSVDVQDVFQAGYVLCLEDPTIDHATWLRMVLRHTADSSSLVLTGTDPSGTAHEGTPYQYVDGPVSRTMRAWYDCSRAVRQAIRIDARTAVGIRTTDDTEDVRPIVRQFYPWQSRTVELPNGQVEHGTTWTDGRPSFCRWRETTVVGRAMRQAVTRIVGESRRVRRLEEKTRSVGKERTGRRTKKTAMARYRAMVRAMKQL